MNLPALNVDVLLYLMKFVKPGDRFNLALSGILKGFENANEGIDFCERIENCGAELGLRRDSTCELEIRSLVLTRLPDESLFKILERLANEGYLLNNREFIVTFESPSSRLNELICPMKNLEKLNLLSCELTIEALANVFQSCSKIIELNIMIWGLETREVAYLKNQLIPGFQRLRYFEFQCLVEDDTWPVIQEMCTWLKECANFTIFNDNQDSGAIADFVIDGSLTLDPTLANCMQISNFRRVPAALAKWFLSVCSNVHAVELELSKLPKSFHNEISRLEKLKELNVWVDYATELKEIVRSCRQVEIFRTDIYILNLEDLAELEPAENLTDVTLRWHGGHTIEEVLPILKRWRHLCRLTFADLYEDACFPPVEVLGDFIMGMKHLSYLHIVPEIVCSNVRMEIFRDKVNELIVPLRPNFTFNISHISVF